MNRRNVDVKYTPRARGIIDIEIQGLQKVREALNAAFDEAVAMMLRCLEHQGKIVVAGIGKNLLVGKKISATLASTGSTSVVLNPSQAMHGDLGIVGAHDVLLALSYSGESEELLLVIPPVRRLGVKVITLTGVPESALGQCSDIVIPVTVDREACPFNMAPTASTTATLAVGDALAMVLLEARGFKKEDYAKLHPGGAIGRALLLRVADIMRTGGRVARVHENDTVKAAVLAMTEARSGSAAVVKGDGRLTGIFTDGDLRRHLTDTHDIVNRPIREVMTPAPVTVQASQLAVDVLCLFEDHNIDDLLVVDSDGRLVGGVDIQDLPKWKIM